MWLTTRPASLPASLPAFCLFVFLIGLSVCFVRPLHYHHPAHILSSSPSPHATAHARCHPISSHLYPVVDLSLIFRCSLFVAVVVRGARCSIRRSFHLPSFASPRSRLHPIPFRPSLFLHFFPKQRLYDSGSDNFGLVLMCSMFSLTCHTS